MQIMSKAKMLRLKEEEVEKVRQKAIEIIDILPDLKDGDSYC
jgi:hypothetical protein